MRKLACHSSRPIRGAVMSIRNRAYIAGAFEHPTRKADDRSLAQLHAEVAKGALDDAGLTKDDVDGYFCAGDAPGLGPLNMADYMGLRLRHVDSTDRSEEHTSELQPLMSTSSAVFCLKK